jgi:hypothetical protein
MPSQAPHTDVVIGAEEEEDDQELEGQTFQEAFRRIDVKLRYLAPHAPSFNA